MDRFYKKMIGVILIFYSVTPAAFAQQKGLRGKVVDSITNIPVVGASIAVFPGKETTITDEHGQFNYVTFAERATEITVTAVGFAAQTMQAQESWSEVLFRLCPRQVQLADVVVRASAVNPVKSISDMDIKMRGVANSQEILRIVPGLFIGQHQGGGKAEQIFLRGFDADHGTDVRISADGIPVNMVSHAHGQGYADSHFVIPETVESVSFGKGPYDASKGDFATAGYLDFHTLSSIKRNSIKIEGGQYNSWRGLAMINLLKKTPDIQKHTWYAASEYNYSDSYFDHPQHFKRFNFFTKYTGELSDRQIITVSAATLYSSWRASGQLPERVVKEGAIGFYGALDPNEGGLTARTTLNIQLASTRSNGDVVKNQLYYSRYRFDVNADFTFFLTDTVHGDEIRQLENRHQLGYQGSYQHNAHIGNTQWNTTAGIDIRLDMTSNTRTLHTMDRYTQLDIVKWGNITELGTGGYVTTAIRFTGRFNLNAGIRYDHFFYRYRNKLDEDPTLQGIGTYGADNQVISPKISLSWQAAERSSVYWSLGKGFHTNDARVVVAADAAQTLPAVYSTDLGVILKPAKNILLHAAVWYSHLQQEYVYGGDGNTVDFSGKTRRVGVDFSGRCQLMRSFYLDLDLNYARGRAIWEEKGKNYIPLAPIYSSTGGLSYTHQSGFNGSLRYRYLAKRPANEDYSLTCQGYFINDLVINYTRRKFEIGLVVNNVFNTSWKETQFDAITRLQQEKTPVEDISFTAGTKFLAKISVSYYF